MKLTNAIFLGSACWAMILALLALGGGLLMAAFCFNSPEQRLATITSTPETVKFPPTPTPSVPEKFFPATLNRLQAPAAEILPAFTSPEPDSSMALSGVSDDLETPSQRSTFLQADSEERINLNTPQPMASAVYLAGNFPQSQPTSLGYEALEATVVPEPASCVFICVGLGALVGYRGLRRRS